MTEYIMKLRCPACKHEEEIIVNATSKEKAKTRENAEKHCPRQSHIKMEVVEINEKCK
jgi:ABC-type metal ion transport system substrate-binding protein